MSHFLPCPGRTLAGSGAWAWDFLSAHGAEDDHAADAKHIVVARTNAPRSLMIALPSFSYRAHRLGRPGLLRARRHNNDHAHVDRRAPPGRNPRGRRQGEPDRGV